MNISPLWNCEILLIFVYFNFSIAFSDRVSPCGKTNLTGPGGIIASPNYPMPFPHQVQCVWSITSPPNAVLKLEIIELDLDVEEHCLVSPCCAQHWLSVPYEGGRGTNLLCGSEAPTKPITIVQETVLITYFSSELRKIGRGFFLRYTIDETPCNPQEMQCRSGACVSNSTRCNGIRDCLDGSDEDGCNNFGLAGWCLDENLPCTTSPKHCFRAKDACNGIFTCPRGEDEVNCAPGCPNQIACSSGDGCYEPYQRCNGIRNCRDNSDETDCVETACGPLQFVCLRGGCVAAVSLCDGINDCGDMSDEQHCAKSSLLTAATLGLLACVFVSCIGLSCLYRFYTARLNATTAFIHHLDPEELDDEFVYREPPPAYSVAVAESRSMPCVQVSEPLPRSNRTRVRRHRRRRSHHCDSRARTSFTPNGILLPKRPVSMQIELAGMTVEPQWSTPCSSPSLSPSRESITSSTSLEDLLVCPEPPPI